MKTERLYWKDAYLQEAEAEVLDANGKYLVLDKSIFYPEKGGQPSDTGFLEFEGEKWKVEYAKDCGEYISLQLDRDFFADGKGKIIKQKIDWEKRYSYMKMHTAIHLLCKVICDKTGGLITGNQIKENESRVDVDIPSVEFNREMLKEFEEKTNSLISENLEIKSYWLKRKEFEENPEFVKLKNKLPPDLQEIRIVDIGGKDIQADGGTHVKNTREFGKLKITETKSKGQDKRRIYFVLEF